MGPVTTTRLRSGALAWLLTLQYFAVETLAQARMDRPYSRAADTISALGATDSPAHRLMNASFLVQAILIVVGVVLLRPALRGGAARAATALLSLAAAGVLVVGIFPRDGYSVAHAIGAVAYVVGAGLGLIALAYAVRPRSEVLGTLLAVLGVIGTAMTVFFLAGVTGYLGEGGTERGAAYVLPIGLAIAGAALWRMGGGEPDAGTSADSGTGLRPRQERQLAREGERARRAEQRRARDEALENAARRAHEPTRPAVDEGANTDGEDEIEPEDPWATSVRRRD
jgi:hypothetical membrane protein